MSTSTSKVKQSQERTRRKRIFVGMSGGVDSSVSAALLKEAGHDVVGVFIKVWQADFLPCTWREERREAMRAAAHLKIPFLTLDLAKEYKEEVVDYMIREYGAGRIPNPDIMCNKHVKFGAFLDFARTHGADAVATGHYARIRKTDALYLLEEGIDTEKDQSYFLSTLTQEQMTHTYFPVGGMKKSAVRTLARRYGLPNAEKKDSQGLCFMGKVSMPEFLAHYLDTKPGKVVDVTGREVGEHDGAMLYTIGQRHGLRIKQESAESEPYVVIDKDIKANTVSVAPKSRVKQEAARERFTLESLTQSYPGAFDDDAIEVRIRYHGERIPAKITNTPQGPEVTLHTPHTDISPGQTAVFYRGKTLIGAGVVKE